MFDRQLLEYRQPVVCQLLILYGATDKNIVIAVTPIGRDAFHEPVDTFGEKVEPEVFANSHHFPTIGTPCVGVLQQEIGRETGEHDLAGLDLPASVSFSLDG